MCACVATPTNAAAPRYRESLSGQGRGRGGWRAPTPAPAGNTTLRPLTRYAARFFRIGEGARHAPPARPKGPADREGLIRGLIGRTGSKTPPFFLLGFGCVLTDSFGGKSKVIMVMILRNYYLCL
jgi:hypothetical protein